MRGSGVKDRQDTTGAPDPWQDDRKRVTARLKRAEGQIRGVCGMIERDEDCEKVAQQLAAARKALDKAFFDVMSCATRRALNEAAVDQPALLQELTHLNQLLVRYG